MELEAPADVTRVDRLDDDDIDTDAEPITDANGLRRGQTIGRYVIVECLGVGGMGVVYSAWDPKLDRKLAIKLVRARPGASGGTRGRNRLLREAQALARVRHPNVITVHDVGALEGRMFVAMEFVEGTTLHQWLEHELERPFRQLLDVFLQAGRGLAAAHRVGLVHRDFKPENVMIGSDGRVLVLDFGIARGPITEIEDPANPIARDRATAREQLDDPLALADPIEARMTRPGAIVGTPSYMSPEQRRSRPLDSRSDQFSFCVALWEALSGERPFGEAPGQKLLARMRLGQIRAMQRRDVPRRVTQALHRGLAWNRNDRFPSMEALLEALNPRGVRTTRLPLALAGAALAVASASFMVGAWSRPELTPALERCTIDRARVDEVWNPSRAQQIAGSLRASAGEQADSTWTRGHERIEDWTQRWLDVRAATCEHHVELAISDELHDLRVACLERQLDRFELVLASVATPGTIGARDLEGLIALLADLPDPDRCTDDLALRERMREPAPASERERLAELWAEADRLEIEFEIAKGSASGGGSELSVGLEPARQLVSAADELAHPPMRARALALLGNYLEQVGASEEAELVLLEAGGTGVGAHEFEIAANAFTGLARLLSARGLHDEGLRWLDLAEGLASALGDPIPVRVSLATTRAAIAYRRGDWVAAEAGFEAARVLLEREGADDPKLALELPLLLQNLALVAERRATPRRALALHRRALAIYERQLGPGHPRIAMARSGLASALLASGDREAALSEFSRALALFESSLGPGRETALVLGQLAAIHDSFGRCTQARELLDRGLAEIGVAAPEGIEHADMLRARASLCDYADDSALDLLELLDHAAAIEGRLGELGPLARSRDAIDRSLALLARSRAEQALVELERVGELRAELPLAERARFDAALGLIARALGRPGQARRALAQARPNLRSGTPLARRVADAIAQLARANE